MASGDHLNHFSPLNNEPPSSAYATLDTRNNHPVLDFDDSSDESAVFSGVLPGSYGGGGLTVDLHLTMESAEADDVVFDVAIERVGTSQDTDSDSFASAQTVTQTVSGTAGLPFVAQVQFESGAEMDNLAAGEEFRLKVTRDANNANDDAAGDAELRKVVVKET